MEGYIKGTVRNIFYKNDNGYMIGIFKIKYTEDEDLQQYLNKTITFTGSFFDIKENGDYIFYGILANHPKYGVQYNVSNYEQIMPESKNGVIAFLSSDLFKGVGLRTATMIVDKLGDKALDLILENHDNLLLIPSMTKNKAKKIHEVLVKEASSYKTMIYLQNLGFSMGEVAKIYNRYKEETNSIIEKNVYQLIEDIDGIGFISTDKIAFKLGVKEDDKERIEACILYIMSDLCLKNGNIYNELEDIYLGVSNYLNFNMEIDPFNYYLLKLNENNKIIITKHQYYLKDYYEAEKSNALKIIALGKNNNNTYTNVDKEIKKLEETENIKYNNEQSLAIKESMNKNFLIITGGPGTGKTTIINAIVNLYKKLNKVEEEKSKDIISLLAPTGRAAKRLKEATGFSAVTIHKFLKWNKETNGFAINEYNKVQSKFIIVDEVSMIDNFLLNSLFKGLIDDVKVILVGDHNQLPSVGSGQVLKDLIESAKVPVIELNYLYRQQATSYIISLAHQINKGVLSLEYKQKKDDYNFIECTKKDIKDIIVKICQKALDKGFNYKDIQVLVPMYKGINGIDAMNKALQVIFNPFSQQKKEKEYQGVIYREGDKVLQIKNNNDIGISNGDIGIIESFLKIDGKEKIIIDFDGEIVTYSLKEFDDVRLGYAISIHKAQGSEFDIVVIPMDLSFNRMLYRKLIYTGITRTKKSLMLVGQSVAFENSVYNVREEKRKTTLKEMIINLI